ncbi:MAG TPA: hypothetical protein VEY91_11875 [Candidatus Limnocylindria bacterium]|nr:hypothetical protein [Candidatus Limnocylindria bacterium]
MIRARSRLRTIASVALLAGCGWRLAAAAPEQRAESPEPTDISYYYDLLEHTVFRPVARALDPSLLVRKVTGRRREAFNVDEQDQVRLPSTWWQPRLGFQPLTVADMIAGLGPTTGPARGKWHVTRAKTQGVTPGFFIKDATGARFILKFDPPNQPEMATGAGVVAAYLYWAAGFNVPNDVIVSFRSEDLAIVEGALYTDPHGHKKPISREFLEQILARVARSSDGTYRALASRLLAGKPLGPFEYRGRRRDDPEDLIPHQLRRELRGLWSIVAWTNHADSRGPNSLDVWVTDGDRSFVRHHLIDFNGCLGSGSIAARSPQTGNEYFVDYGVMARSLLTLGLRRARWETTVDPQLPSIGFIEASAFDPEGWRPDYPNPAFDERTERDVRWGVRIVAGFTDEHIRAAVEQAQFSDPRATEYLTQVLIQRRDILVRRWLIEPQTATTTR